MTVKALKPWFNGGMAFPLSTQINEGKRSPRQLLPPWEVVRNEVEMSEGDWNEYRRAIIEGMENQDRQIQDLKQMVAKSLEAREQDLRRVSDLEIWRAGINVRLGFTATLSSIIGTFLGAVGTILMSKK